VLEFTDGLAYNYLRETVTLNANAVSANHGETVAAEVLGSGNGAAANQRFELRKPPLTHVSAATASGARSTLSVRVDGVEWKGLPSLYGQDENSQSYTVRIDDDAVPTVLFGDGKSGARLPTGQENVIATYRSGIGSEGEVAAGSLTLLKTRPFGVRDVSNPLLASGAGDPEKLADARANAPLTVLTLDRIVSLRDYQDFACGFAGIGKAQATAIWDGEAERVHLTVADASGDAVVSPLFENLLDAMESVRDPLREVVLASYQSFVFFVTAKVKIDPAYLWDDVRGAVEAALRATFAFERRSFAQPVPAAEVLQVIHSEAGVVAVDLDELYKTTPDASSFTGAPFNSVLGARTARYDALAGKILPAQLLRIQPLGIALKEMKS
jgi:predicted phage baseplate assembly protein